MIDILVIKQKIIEFKNIINHFKRITLSSNKDEGIVYTWDKVTKILSYVSILELIIEVKRYKMKKLSSNYIEVRKERDKLYKLINRWVVWNARASIIVSIVMFNFFNSRCKILIYIVLIYGFFRVFEIIVKQIRVILFDTIGKNSVAVKGVRRSIILLLYNIVEMIFWFSTTYMGIVLLEKENLKISFIHLKDIFSYGDFTVLSALNFTVYSSEFSKVKDLIKPGNLLSTIAQVEIIVGFIIIVISLARFFGELPGLKTNLDNKRKLNRRR